MLTEGNAKRNLLANGYEYLKIGLSHKGELLLVIAQI